MAIKFNPISFLDKGFFGKTMTEWSNFQKTCKVSRTSNLKMSSIDDFNKHFYNKMAAIKSGNNLDTFSKEDGDIRKELSLLFDN